MEQLLTNSLITGAGSFGAGYLVGYGIKKVLRFIIIIAGAITGIFFVALALMQKHGYISNIKWDAMANDIYTSANTTLTSSHMSNIHDAVSLPCPTVCGILNSMAAIHLRELTTKLVRDLQQKTR